MNAEEKLSTTSGYAAKPYIGKGNTRFNPKSLENLKRITPETARANQAKSVESKLANIAAREAFKLNAKNFQQVMADLPLLSPLDIMRMSIHHSISENNWEDAARYAAMLAEFTDAKLSRVEQTNVNKTADLTDEELQEIIKQEGL